MLSTAKLMAQPPCSLNSVGPVRGSLSPWPPPVGVSYTDSVAGWPKIPWVMIIPGFQAPVVSQSQTIVPPWRWNLDLQVKESDWKSLFTKASLPSQSCQCLRNPQTWIKALWVCGLTLLVELVVWFLGCLFYFVLVSLASPSLPGK
jgi:hypothetical protein